MSEGDRFLSLAEVAKRVRVHRLTLTKYIERGDLKAYRIGAVYRLRQEDVDDWLERSRVQPRDADASERSDHE